VQIYQGFDARGRGLKRTGNCTKLYIISNFKVGDPDGFTQVVQDYNKISQFDNWHVKMLVKVELPQLLDFKNKIFKIKRHCGDGGDVKNEGGTEEEDDLR
jgi:hypothetical protein